MSKIFFTSDTHFGHENIIKYSKRPFKNANHMNEVFIENWNKTVDEDDEVYHLGDVSLMSAEKTIEILERLNGKVYLIKGNHEKSVMSQPFTRNFFEWIKPKHEIRINGIDITLDHYAGRVWNKSHHGSILLYGHSHDSLDIQGHWGKSMDVGVDSANRLFGEYRPISFEEIMKIMNKREIKTVDHHK